MPRDYKNAGRGKQAPQKQGSPGWLIFTAGVLFGLSIASVIWVREHGMPEFVGDRVAALTDAAGQPEATKPGPVDDGPTPGQKPRFDFYTILPEMEVAIPEWKLRPGAQSEARAIGGPFILQAGSFRNVADAERLRAELGLLGMQSQIQSVAVNGRDTWHRVRIGPIADGARVESMRRRLAEHKIDAMLLRLKTGD